MQKAWGSKQLPARGTTIMANKLGMTANFSHSRYSGEFAPGGAEVNATAGNQNLNTREQYPVLMNMRALTPRHRAGTTDEGREESPTQHWGTREGVGSQTWVELGHCNAN